MYEMLRLRRQIPPQWLAAWACLKDRSFEFGTDTMREFEMGWRRMASCLGKLLFSLAGVVLAVAKRAVTSSRPLTM